MKRILLAAVAAVLLGFPCGWMLAMVLTPVFWRLEPILHVELAGHSGPSDWLILTIMAITVFAAFLLFLRVFAPSRSRK